MTNTMNPLTQPESAGALTLSPEQTQIQVQVERMARGGHGVAQHDGRVVFVRHAIPGETVIAKLTGVGPSGRYLLADTIKVVAASEFRRAHQWKIADPLRSYAAGRPPIGGAEYGHIVLEYQRRLKANVFRDKMVRLGEQIPEDMEISVAGMDCDGASGMHWRTRNAFVISEAGRLCLPVHRSLQKVRTRNVPLAVPQLDALELWDYDFSGATRVEVVTPHHGREALITIVPDPHIAGSENALQKAMDAWRLELSELPEHVSIAVSTPSQRHRGTMEVTTLRGRDWVTEEVVSDTHGSHDFRVSNYHSWPVHKEAPAVLVDAVLQAAQVQPGDVVAELYGGSGLYSRFLAAAVGADGAVLSVEPRPAASEDAQVNLEGLPQATALHGNVNHVMSGWLRAPELELASGGLNGRRMDTVVLNAPKKGARSATLSRVDKLGPDKIVYVSQDPVSLARDTKWLTQRQWKITSIDAYDFAPNTHEVQTICVFTRA